MRLYPWTEPSRRSLVRALVDRDVSAACRVRAAPPVAPALAQPQTRELGHQVELAGPDVANLDGKELHALRADDDLLARDTLRDRIVPREQEIEARRLDAVDLHALPSIEPRWIGDEACHHEHAVAGEARGRTTHARDLRFLREQAVERAEHDVDERVFAFHGDVREVTERDGDSGAAGLRPHAIEHCLRRLDAVDGDASGGEWDRDAAGSDAELERVARARELREYLDLGGGIEVRVDVVVDRSPGVAVERGVGHGAVILLRRAREFATDAGVTPWYAYGVLRTARLLLRRFEPGDVEDALAYRNDAEFARHLPHVPQPFTREDAEAFVRQNIEEPWDELPTFAVVLDGRVIGTVNLEIDAASRTAMLGYAISRACWGRGIATEAARAVLDWAIAEHQLLEVWASTAVANVRSQRVMQKLGMRRDDALTERGEVRYWIRVGEGAAAH